MSDDTLTVAKDLVVQFDYHLTDDDGATIDKSQPGQPMAYLHGHRNIVPGLEKELVGLGIGDEKKVVVKPEEGYGVSDPSAFQEVPRDAFEGAQGLQPGMPVQGRAPNGQVQMFWIAAIGENGVTLTTNHPLADKTLHFDVKIQGIRAAQPVELEHGHVHGPGGHQH